MCGLLGALVLPAMELEPSPLYGAGDGGMSPSLSTGRILLGDLDLERDVESLTRPDSTISAYVVCAFILSCSLVDTTNSSLSPSSIVSVPFAGEETEI